MVLHGSVLSSAKYGNCHEVIQFSRLILCYVNFISMRKENTAFEFKMRGVHESNSSRNEVWGGSGWSPSALWGAGRLSPSSLTAPRVSQSCHHRRGTCCRWALFRNELRGWLNGTGASAAPGAWQPPPPFSGVLPRGVLAASELPSSQTVLAQSREGTLGIPEGTFFHGLRRGSVCSPWESLSRLQDSRPLFCV